MGRVVFIILAVVGFCAPYIEAGDSWFTLQGGNQRQGLADVAGPEFGCIQWQFSSTSPVYQSVTIGPEGNMYFGREDGTLCAVNPEGVQQWCYSCGAAVSSAPVVGADGCVYVGLEDGKILAVDAPGILRWSFETEGMVYSSAAVGADGTVFIGSGDGTLYAIDPNTTDPNARIRWSFDTGTSSPDAEGAILASPAIGTDGKVYIGGVYDPCLYAVDSETGETVWAHEFSHIIDDPYSDPIVVPGRFVASPVVANDGRLYVSPLHDPHLYAVNPDDGSIIWQAHLADPCVYPFGEEGFFTDCGWEEPVLGPEGTIYVGCMDPYVRAIDPNGNLSWVTRLGEGEGFTMAAGADGLLYACGTDGHLYVVSAAGEILSCFSVEGGLYYPVLDENGTLYVSSSYGSVYALDVTDCSGEQAVLHVPGDVNQDWRLDFGDFSALAVHWGDEVLVEGAVYGPGDINRDLKVDLADLAQLAGRWLYSY